MGFDYIIFDLDGTLTDSEEGITKSVQYALAHYGIIEEDTDKLRRFIGPSLNYSFREYYGFEEAKAKEVTAKYRERFSTIGIYENTLYEGVVDMLKGLKNASKRIALGTSKPLVYAQKILDYFDISQFFDVVCGVELEGVTLDKAGIIHLAIQKLGLSKSEYSKIVMVGDTKYDIIGARTVGIASVGVRYGFAPQHELEREKADFILDTVAELKKFLLKN